MEYEQIPLTVEQLKALHADLHPGRVSQRSGGGGNTLHYLEAWDVKAMLIRVFGYAGFSADVTESEIVQIIPDPENAKRYTVLAKCTVRITIHQTGATYTETAAASQTGAQGIGEVTDFALKTAESDALKRAAIYLGSQFGLSLYRGGQTGDVVRRVFSPDQEPVVADIVAARQNDPDNPQFAAAAAQRLEDRAAQQRLQARLKVHQPAPEPETPAEEPAQQAQEPAQEPAGEPEKPKAAPRARKASTARQKVAEQALADAEAAVGMRQGGEGA